MADEITRCVIPIGTVLHKILPRILFAVITTLKSPAIQMHLFVRVSETLNCYDY